MMGRTYYRTDIKIWYQKNFRLFSSRTDTSYEILLYCENGKFYEFLTGTFLGTSCRGNYLSSDHLSSDEFGFICSLGAHTGGRNATPVSAEDFSRYAKRCMEDKEKIVPYLNKKFDEWRESQRKVLEKENRKNHPKPEDTTWLDDMLNNRK